MVLDSTAHGSMGGKGGRAAGRQGGRVGEWLVGCIRVLGMCMREGEHPQQTMQGHGALHSIWTKAKCRSYTTQRQNCNAKKSVTGTLRNHKSSSSQKQTNKQEHQRIFTTYCKKPLQEYCTPPVLIGGHWLPDNTNHGNKLPPTGNL